MRRLFLAAALCLGLLVPASSAVAAPTGIYAPFNNCPLANPVVNVCLYSKVSSGTVTLGAKPVPIKNPVTVQAGLAFKESIFETATLIPGADGTAISKTPQPVPGGLLGVTAPGWWPKFLRDWFNETINNGFTGVTATMEPVGPATINLGNVSGEQGVGLTMLVRVKLDNPFLGSSCYIGSPTNPIKFNLTTGTTSPPAPNKPISGKSTALEEQDEGNMITVPFVKLVDNSLAGPAASGCGGLFSFLVDPFVNSIVGLPSAAGTNTVILEGENKLASAFAVKASE